MGAGLLAFYRDRVKRPWKTAFASAFFIGLLVHLYKFTNTLYIRDSVLNDYASQNVVRSGRWFLSVACSLSSWFDLPWLIGLFSLVLIGLTAAVIADLFRMENPVVIVLSSGLLVSFPAITATFFYEYTADGYLLAMLLAALTARLTVMNGRGKLRWVAAGVSLCFSCGIYQAYVSFALLLSICHFLQEAWRAVGLTGTASAGSADRRRCTPEGWQPTIAFGSCACGWRAFKPPAIRASTGWD